MQRLTGAGPSGMGACRRCDESSRAQAPPGRVGVVVTQANLKEVFANDAERLKLIEANS